MSRRYESKGIEGISDIRFQIEIQHVHDQPDRMPGSSMKLGSQTSGKTLTRTLLPATGSDSCLTCCTSQPAYGQNGVVIIISTTAGSSFRLISRINPSSTTFKPISGSNTLRSAVLT